MPNVWAAVMANQRGKGLKLIGAYIPEKKLEAIRKVAKRRKMSVADLLRQLIEDAIDNENSK